ncbi:MAG: hypothetical protein ACT4R6_13260 [Gemmatimonadaceae bacterium]
MQRLFLTSLALTAVAACAPATPEGADTPMAAAATGPAAGTTEWKIQTFTTAAPAAIAANAAVFDWNDSTNAPTTELRKGSNGWTCLPLQAPPAGGYTSAAEAAPMCGDGQAMLWGEGYMSKTKPKNTMLGLAYMLHGDVGASNTDPYATAQAADNDWVVTGPHVMFLPADPSRIRDVSTDHKTGAPYQMWKGTPYAHIMMPVAAHQ